MSYSKASSLENSMNKDEPSDLSGEDLNVDKKSLKKNLTILPQKPVPAQSDQNSCNWVQVRSENTCDTGFLYDLFPTINSQDNKKILLPIPAGFCNRQLKSKPAKRLSIAKRNHRVFYPD